jgi:Protein of unknown function (DUF2946)
MDDIVKQALAKWPQVPHCHGWLGLDARGNWYMRDDRAQAAGAFPSWFGAASQPGAKGSLLRHDKLIDFIGRNYEPDAQGQWFFQNGPQRVYVELEAAPWVWRLTPLTALDGVQPAPPGVQGPVPTLRIATHTGLPAVAVACLADELGRVYLQCDLGFGVVHSQDVEAIADQVEAGQLQVQAVVCADLPARFAYVPSPQQRARANGF